MADGLDVRAGILTDVGRGRSINEDWCGVLEPRGAEQGDGWLWVVADGVGAYGTGEEASRAAGEAIIEACRRSPHLDTVSRLRAAIDAGNRAVWECRRQYSRQGQMRPVMTTALAAFLEGERAILANVGDCRAYLIRNGRLHQLTHDHTWVGEQVARGTMSPEEARNHPRSHVITRALGQYETVEADLYEEPLQPGDRLVLCSDGLTRHLEDEEILTWAGSAGPDLATEAMVELANRRGGEDNITVAVIEVVAVPAADRAPAPASSPPAPARRAEPAPPPHEGPPVPRPAAKSPIGDGHSAADAPAAGPQAPPGEPATRRDYLSALHAISLRISASLDLTETLDSVVDSLVELTGGERGFIMLWDETAGELVYSIGRNVSAAGRQAPEFSRNLVHSVFRTGTPIRVGDALADDRLSQHASVIAQNLRSVLCAPLEAKGKRIGVVYVDSRLGADIFTEADLELVCAFAGQAAVALDNARLYEQLKRQTLENAAMRSNHENVLRSLNSAIVSLDAEGRVVLFSRMAEEIFGVAADYAGGRTLQELLPASLHRALAAVAAPEKVEPGAGPHEIQVEARLPHRGRAALSVKGLPLVDEGGRSIGTVLIVDDITHQRLLNEARQREATEKERIRAIFGRFLAPSLVEQLMDAPESIQLGGVRREVTVLFADIRGFTGISERHPPEEVVKILNSYLACATDVIFGVGGTLDKFIGDGVMAFFNAPLPQEDHVLAATRAAMLMQTRLRELQPSGQRTAFGVGINTGEAVVGNIGTPELMNYTIIGDVVNVAARLQGEARAGEVVLSGSAYEQVADAVEVEELGAIHVKGRAQPVQIYKVLRLLT